MNKDIRSVVERATQNSRKLLEDDFAAQLEGQFDVSLDGAVAEEAGRHLSAAQVFQRERIVSAIEHKRATGFNPRDAVRDYLRDAAFTTLNRLVALKMLEARELVQECITRGEHSAGYREFCGMAPGLPLLPESAGYRIFVESLFDELSTEVKVLFDRRDPASVLWPKRATFEQLLECLNASELAGVWAEDETIGWVYQFFNGQDERRKMREESGAPRNSRELAVRNQFFTPRYVVQFLTDNTLGRIWYEMRCTKTVLAERCQLLVRRPSEDIAPRAKKDPRDLRVLDPACGSGHFLLYAFDLLIPIYEEAYADLDSPKSEATGRTLAEDYPSLDAVRKAVPGLVLAHNLYGVDIDARCAQIAQLALWMRAQKAYRDFGVARAERAQIRRSNIVVAEPLVSDEKIANEFIARLGDPELGRVFTSLVDSLSLAGDLGLLLRVEELVETSARKQGELFAPAEERIRAALDQFVREGAHARNTRRRLFVEDAAHGVALLRVAERKFDTVLMNPPFGEATARGEEIIGEYYPQWASNILCAFFFRALELTAPGGLVGAIFDRTVVVKSSYEDFRRNVFVGDDQISYFADLGWSVLDANVEVASCVLSKYGNGKSGVFINARSFAPENKADCILDACRAFATGRVDPVLTVERSSEFSMLPNAVVGYDFPVFLRRAFRSFKSIAADGLKAYQGHALKADKHFRLRWEVDRGTKCVCLPLFNGAGFSPYVTTFLDCVISPVPFGRLPKDTATVLRNSDQHGLPGVCFGKRGEYFAAHLLPAGFVFTVEGQAIPVEDAWRAIEILGFLNTPLVRFSLNRYCGQHKYSGYVNLLPLVPFEHPSEVRRRVLQAVRSAREAQRHDELQSTYVGPPKASSLAGLAGAYSGLIRAAQLAAEESERYCNSELVRKLDLTADEAALVKAFAESQPEREVPLEDADQATDFKGYAATGVISHAFGSFVGRWQVGKVEATDAGSATSDIDVNSLLVRLATDAPAAAAAVNKSGKASRADVWVDDPGHAHDTEALLRSAVEALWEGDAEALINDVCRELNVGGLRDYLSHHFFANHIRQYSKSRRKAPIYWQLATPSASYSVWLYIHAFSNDTLFRVQNDFVAPKLAHEERGLESLTREVRDEATAGQRKNLAAQGALVEELRAFLDEVKRVAPLWKPNLDDGVLLNFAPLWRLVPQNKLWQKELKATWDELCEGKYDWAQLAMHLWPERVVPKCAKDRGLAIAHGLENVLWVEGPDGKWTARKTVTKTVEELVRERTSTAVKSALKSLLEAPVASGKITGRKGGGRRKAAAAADEGDA